MNPQRRFSSRATPWPALASSLALFSHPLAIHAGDFAFKASSVESCSQSQRMYRVRSN